MGKILKRIILIGLVIACLFNVVWKLVHKLPLKQELQQSAEYVSSQKENEDK